MNILVQSIDCTKIITKIEVYYWLNEKNLSTFFCCKGDYEYNKCSGTDCIPCEQRFTLCKDKPDGPNALPGEEVTGRYVKCSQGVALGIMICPDEKIYNPQERKCKLSNKGKLHKKIRENIQFRLPVAIFLIRLIIYMLVYICFRYSIRHLQNTS